MALATTLHLYIQDKITGISGTLFRCISFLEFHFNFSFIMGMLSLSSFIKCFYDPSVQYIKKYSYTPTFLESPAKFVADLSIPGFILAGFLIGFVARQQITLEAWIT